MSTENPAICQADIQLVRDMNPTQKEIMLRPSTEWPAWAARDMQLAAAFRTRYSITVNAELRKALDTAIELIPLTKETRYSIKYLQPVADSFKV